MKDYYSILSLKPDASLDNIKKRHRELTLNFLNYRNEEAGIAQDFAQESEAFYVLKNIKRKQVYDSLYGTYYGNEILKERKIVVKWKAKIKEAAHKGKAYGKRLVQMSDNELSELISEKKKKRSSNLLYHFAEVIMEFVFEIIVKIIQA